VRQTEAKRFFVDKVVAQARAEGMTLSGVELRMLSWSESDPDLVVDPELPARQAFEISDEEYEKKIAGLLSRCFKADVEKEPEAEAQYREAASVLRQGDHYILVMVDDAVGRQLKRWWQFWR